MNCTSKAPPPVNEAARVNNNAPPGPADSAGPPDSAGSVGPATPAGIGAPPAPGGEQNGGQKGQKGGRAFLKRLVHSNAFWVVVVAAVLGTLYWFWGCPIKHFTGLSCPGCGMTRALLEAAQGHWALAFYYHPLFLLLPVFAFLLLSRWVKARPRLRNAGLILIGLVFMAVYVYRFSAYPELVNYTPRWPVDLFLGAFV